MNINTKILNKIVVNQLQEHIERIKHHYQDKDNMRKRKLQANIPDDRKILDKNINNSNVTIH